jgi:hypothetical protein
MNQPVLNEAIESRLHQRRAVRLLVEFPIGRNILLVGL